VLGVNYFCALATTIFVHSGLSSYDAGRAGPPPVSSLLFLFSLHFVLSQRLLTLAQLGEVSNRALDLAPSVAIVLEEMLRPYLEEGETLPDIAFLQKLLGRRIQSDNQELISGDHDRRHRKNVEQQRLMQLRESAAKLKGALVEVRFFLDRTLEKKVANSVFEGRSDLSKLKSPVLERVSERLASLLEDPKMGWDQLADAGHRTNLQINRERLAATLAEYLRLAAEVRAERGALVHSKGNFDRDLSEKGRWLRRSTKWLAGFFLGAGFDREAADLARRRRATPRPQEEMKPETDSSFPAITAPLATESAPFPA